MDIIAEHEMAQSQVKQFNVESNESAPDEMARYLIKLYSTTSDVTPPKPSFTLDHFV